MTKRELNVRDIKLEPERKNLIQVMFKEAPYLLSSNYRAKEIITKLLLDIGITKVAKKDRWNVSELYFSSPTLVFIPNLVGVNKFTSSLPLSQIITNKFKPISGWNTRLVINKIYTPLDNNIKRLIYSDVVIGDYYKDRNLLLINFNMFYNGMTLSMIKTVCDFLKEVLDKNEVKLDSNVDVNYILEQQKRDNIKSFANYIREEIKSIERYNEYKYKQIKSWHSYIINNYKAIELNHIKLEKLNEFLVNFNDKFEKRLQELEELEFIKNVEFNSEGILLDIGNLSIEHKEIKAYIGYMKILITPSEIKVYNKYPMKSLQHPHVRNNMPCFGTFDEGISKLQGTMDLKRLAVVLYQFLHTYTNRGCFSGGYLHYWKSFRDKEKKFDEDGNLITKNKQKTIVSDTK